MDELDQVVDLFDPPSPLGNDMEEADLVFKCNKCGRELKCYPSKQSEIVYDEGVAIIGVEICPCLPKNNRPRVIVIGESDDQASEERR